MKGEKNQKEICYDIRTMGTEALRWLKKRDTPQAPNEEGKGKGERRDRRDAGRITNCNSDQKPNPRRLPTIHCPRRSRSPTGHAIVRDTLPCAGAAEKTSSARSVQMFGL